MSFSKFLENHQEEGAPEILTKFINLQETQDYIKQPAIDKLIPEKILMYSKCWLPERTEEKVVQKIVAEYSDVAIASLDEKTNNLLSFSYLKFGQCPYGTRCDIFYQGNDLPDLVSHFTLYMRHLQETRSDIPTLCVLLYFPTIFDRQKVEEALSMIPKPVVNEVFSVQEYVIISEENH